MVVATRDRWPDLRVSLTELSSLPEQPALIVVDNGSSDGTPALLRRFFPDVEVVALAANQGAAGRTVGARLARSEIIAFSDDDSWWQPGSLAVAAELFSADPALGLLAGTVVVGEDRRVDPIVGMMAAGSHDQWRRRSAQGRRSITGCLACGAVVRRSAFLAAGGFEPYFVIGAEETLLVMDLAAGGWKTLFAPEITAHHWPSSRRDSSGRRRRQLRNGLLTAWLRQRPASAADTTVGLLGHILGRPSLWPALGATWHAAGWAAARRRPLPTDLDPCFRAAPGR